MTFKFFLQSRISGGLRLLFVFLAALLGITSQVHAQCNAPANPIVKENCLTGNPATEWDIQAGGTGDLTIQGFTTDISVTPGNTVSFKINTDASAYSINIYRMGYYAGQGARKVATISPSANLPQKQPACLTDTPTGMTDCGNWSVSASWTVPTTAVSGIYFAHLVRSDTGGDSHVVFVVRNDASSSAILFQTSDTTWQAYNYYGNGGLYGPGVPNFDLPNRTFGVSYNRPILTRGFEGESNTFVFGAEYPMVKWLESNGYDVSYFSGVDAARNGSLIKNHKVYMDTGHDEYVSGPARANIEAARDAGVNLAFFSGNEIFWKTRFTNSVDGSNSSFRSMICYKETLAFAKLDPGDPPTWTGTWRDPSFSPPADGGRPENALTGTLFVVNGTGVDNPGNQTIKVPAADGQMRLWRNTAAATLAPGATYTLVPGSLGYEWDIDADNGARPAGAFQMSTSTYPLTADNLLDYGATYGAGIATHHLMMHRAPSGALIFGAGTVNWSWGLSNDHDNPWGFANPDPDINMEQATINLFADMGVQPATLQPGLKVATASTDTKPPSSTILVPAAGATVNTGNSVTVSGTAADTGGQVGGVEVSTDAGATWHPATGRANWAYTWTPTAVGKVSLMSRAVDDSANLEVPGVGTSVNVAPQNCPCTIFGTSLAPTAADSGDANGIEVGVKFRADADGSILGVRFFKSAANTGTHVGHVWSSSGQLLGTATFSGESATGWQQVNFSSPIAATANTTYIASYVAPAGHYSADSFYYEKSGHDNPPLHALANGVDGSDGVYVYGAAGGFPTLTFNATNYWVDVIFASSNTYAISGTISGIGGGGALVTLSGPENLSTSASASGAFTFDGVVNGTYTVSVSNPGVVFTPPSQTVTINFAGASGVNFAATVSNPLTLGGTITGGSGATVYLAGAATQSATAGAGGSYSFTGLLSGTYTITPAEPSFIFNPSTQVVTLNGASNTSVNFTGQVCTCISIFQPTDAPAVADSGDGNAVELGVKFRADSPAALTGIRFYKAVTNTGTHVGHLWSSSGVLLATATFPGETASGWQQGYFTTPVQVAANTTYVASYLAPAGHYSATSNYFQTAGVDRPPLHALADGFDGGNGVYVYGMNGSFPSNSFSATNYWVDVLYAAQPYNLSGTITGPGAAGATVSLSGTSSATTTADSNGNYQFTGIFGGNYIVTPTQAGAVFNPGSQAAVVSSANVTGVNFIIPSNCPCNTVWPPTAKPTAIDGGDPQSIEVGTKVRVDADGYVLGVRFYKSATNIGTHVANLWAADGVAQGTLLATGTFVNETAAGWQQVLFPTPVPVQANTTYVVSYLAPAGHYSGDSQFFATAGVDSPPLHALATGVDGADGVYAYGATSAYPTTTFGAANYWVDMIYAPTSTHSIAGTITGPGGVHASVSLSGTSSATATADASGNYLFSGLQNGVYTVTPSAIGYTMAPVQQSVTINGAHVLGVNFSATVPTYAVSGTVSGAPGIPMTLAGPTTQTTVADPSGNYIFAAVPNGTYTVTPSSVGFAVTPASQTITVSNAAVPNINFAGSVLLYSIGGTITGGANASVALSGPTNASTIADAAGNYAFSNLPVGTYTVVPTVGPTAITNPGNLTLTLTNASVTNANFAVPAKCPCNTIFPAQSIPKVVDFADSSSVEVGVKFRADADAYIIGMRFYKAFTNTGTHLGRIWSSTGTLLGNATFVNESSNGWQQVLFSSPVAVAANTTYVASYFAPVGHYAADTGYFLNAGVDNAPLHALANGIDGPNGVFLTSPTGGFPNTSFNSNAANYWVDVIYAPSATYSIGGSIAGLGGPGATVSVTGAATASAIADASGNFSIAGLSNGFYVVTPTKPGFAITPLSLQATINSTHALGLTFSSSDASTNSISGTITGPGAGGTTVSLSGASSASVLTTATGSFSFGGLSSGAYVVTLSNPAYVFTPASQNVTITSSNAVLSFSSAAQTYAITGNVTGAGASGATITVTGTSTATTTTGAGGSYSLTGLPAGSYTVTATEAGFSFTPASQAVPLTSANGTANFASTAQTFSITGTISGAGGPAAAVSLSGTGTATTTADATGRFTFAGLLNGSYVVSPAKTGFTYAPANQTVVLASANATVSFASTANPTFSISGTVSGTGGNGATVTLTGAATASVAAGATGTYSFAGLPAGTYTVTPAKSGFTFTPASQTVTITTASVTANFASSVVTHTLSGTITQTGGLGATVKLAGAVNASVLSNSSNGTYTFSGLPDGAYTVTPAKSGWAFSPATANVTLAGANAVANFSSTPTIFTVSGTISGAGGNGATINLSGPITATSTASTAGAYSFTGLPAGTYTISPSRFGFTFAPPSQTITITTANVTANFATTIVTHTLSGTITQTGGLGATVRLGGAVSASVISSSSGTYSFTGLPDGAYTVTPAKGGWAFSPATANVTVAGANVVANFTSSPTIFTLSGTISGTGGIGATVSLSGASTATVTASSAGVYSFTGLPAGTYTVSPSKAGFSFTPPSQTVTITSANAVVNFATTVITHTISGTITQLGGLGATVRLGGARSASVLSNPFNGTYAFTGLPDGVYTVTPAKGGFKFSPATASITVAGANVVANFSSSLAIFTLGKTVTGRAPVATTSVLAHVDFIPSALGAADPYRLRERLDGEDTPHPCAPGVRLTPGTRSCVSDGAHLGAMPSPVRLALKKGREIAGADEEGAATSLPDLTVRRRSQMLLSPGIEGEPLPLHGVLPRLCAEPTAHQA